MLTQEEQLVNTEAITMGGVLKSKVLSSAVCMLYLSDRDIWRYSGWTGFVSLVQDYNRKCYAMRIVDFTEQKVVWEQELYLTMEYVVLTPWFHTFAADNCMVGLSFCSEIDNTPFSDEVLRKIENRHRKRNSKAQRQTGPPGGGTHTPPAGSQQQQQQQQQQPSVTQVSPQPTSQPATKNEVKHSKSFFGKPKKHKKVITRVDISSPGDFRHLSHVGASNVSSMNIEALSEDWKKALKMANITPADLENNEQLAATLANTMGKYESEKRASSSTTSLTKTPTGPGRAAPPPPTKQNRAPPPPSHGNRSAAPPRTPIASTPAPPTPPAQHTPGLTAPPAPPTPPVPGPAMGAAPPPPPPPPPPVAAPAAPAFKVAANGGGARTQTPPAGEKGDLLSSIRQFKQDGGGLKSVDDRKIPDAEPPTDVNDMANVLMAAMGQHKTNLGYESTDEEDNEWSDDDWSE